MGFINGIRSVMEKKKAAKQECFGLLKCFQKLQWKP